MSCEVGIRSKLFSTELHFLGLRKDFRNYLLCVKRRCDIFYYGFLGTGDDLTQITFYDIFLLDNNLIWIHKIFILRNIEYDFLFIIFRFFPVLRPNILIIILLFFHFYSIVTFNSCSIWKLYIYFCVKIVYIFSCILIIVYELFFLVSFF